MNRQRGAALVVAMLLAALAAAVTVGLAVGQERWRAGVESRRGQVQAEALARAGVQWARKVLDDDAKSSAVDTLAEPWALPLPATPIGNGSVQGRIVDAQALLNVNNLAERGSTADVERVRLVALATQQGAAPALVAALAEALDPTAAGGAADGWYQSATPPRLAPAAPLMRAVEIAGLRGVDAATLARIGPFVTALPPPTVVNVNTAPPEVLRAALPGLDDDAAAALVAGRARKPFTTIAELRARLPQSVGVIDERALGVGSRFFLVDVEAVQGESRAHASALLRRDPVTPTVVVWQVVE